MALEANKITQNFARVSQASDISTWNLVRLKERPEESKQSHFLTHLCPKPIFPQILVTLLKYSFTMVLCAARLHASIFSPTKNMSTRQRNGGW